MSLWEFTFALSAVILGLALTHIAATIHKLLLVGKRVKWAAEPVLLTTIVLLVIVAVWLGAWFDRDIASLTIGQMLLQVSKLLVLYIAAASCLPEPDRTGVVNLREYYDRTRILTFGALFLSYLMFRFHGVTTDGLPPRITLWVALDWFFYPAVYISLIFVRQRWFNILALGLVIVSYCWLVVGLRLAA